MPQNNLKYKNFNFGHNIDPIQYIKSPTNSPTEQNNFFDKFDSLKITHFTHKPGYRLVSGKRSFKHTEEGNFKII